MRCLAAITTPTTITTAAVVVVVVFVVFWALVSVLDSGRRRAWVQIAAATLSGDSFRQTVHAHRACVHQAAKLVAVLLRVAMVTAGLTESNGSACRRVYDSRHLQADCKKTGISCGTLRSVIEYWLPSTVLVTQVPSTARQFV